MTDWQFFQGRSEPEPLEPIKDRPAWRKFMPAKTFEAQWQVKSKERWSELTKQERLKINTRAVEKGKSFRICKEEGVESAEEILIAVNSALALRRPLLVVGKPGSGKTSLAYAIAHELHLGPVLVWPITNRSTLQDALYRYDAIARLQDSQFYKLEIEVQNLLFAQDPKFKSKLKDTKLKDTKTQKNNTFQFEAEEKLEQFKKDIRNLGSYIKLGPVGTAFLPSELPRVLLIDEIDKSDLNLPNDLLNLFEEGGYEIPELVRQEDSEPMVTVQTADDGLPADIYKGKVSCYEFPLIIMTSNNERDFPPAFLRRCLRIKMPDFKEAEVLNRVVSAHFQSDAHEKNWDDIRQEIDSIIRDFAKRLKKTDELATDQLLNLVYMVHQSQVGTLEAEHANKDKVLIRLKELLLKRLNSEVDGQ